MNDHVLYNGYNYKIFVNGKKKYIRTRNGNLALSRVMALNTKEHQKNPPKIYFGGGDGTTCGENVNLLGKIAELPKEGINITMPVSGNSVFHFLNAIDKEKNENGFFIKFQLNEKADDILIDAYNSIILNNMQCDNNIKDHFPIYVASYPLPLTPVNCNKTFKFEPTYNDNKNVKCFNTIIYKTIQSNISLKDILEKKDDNTILQKINMKITDLLFAISTIGFKYGFVHNDLHLNNVLYDTQNHVLKLIDFGRSFFSTVTPCMQKKLSILKKEHYSLRTDNDDYHKFMKESFYIKKKFIWVHSNLLVGNQVESFKKYLFMFDVVSFTIKCMLSPMYKSNQLISSDCNFLKVANLEAFITNNELIYLPFLPGLYWLRLFLEQIEETYGTAYVKANGIHIHLKKINKWFSGDFTVMNIRGEDKIFNFDIPTQEGDTFLNGFISKFFKVHEKQFTDLLNKCWQSGTINKDPINLQCTK